MLTGIITSWSACADSLSSGACAGHSVHVTEASGSESSTDMRLSTRYAADWGPSHGTHAASAQHMSSQFDHGSATVQFRV